MKKILIVLLTVVLLFGCAKNDQKTTTNGSGSRGNTTTSNNAGKPATETTTTTDDDSDEAEEEEEEEKKFENPTYGNYDDSRVSCGSGLIKDIPKQVPKVVHILYIVVLIAVPILLVVLGMLDLMKGLTSQKEDEIKKGQQIFVKRLIAGILVFFIMMIVKLVTSLVADNNVNVIKCMDCFINDKCGG